MNIDFNTREYRFSHGAEPRGRGSWAFDFGSGPEFCSLPMGAKGMPTLGEAKRWAAKVARERGVRTVAVLP